MKELTVPPVPRISHTTYFTMYDSTGKITRTVSASTDNVCPPSLRPGEFRLEGKGHGITQKVIAGQLVDKTPAEMDKLKRKNPRLRFDTVG